MIESEDVLVLADESSVAFEEKRGLSPWWILGAMLFVIAFMLGWRSAGKKRAKERSGRPERGA